MDAEREYEKLKSLYSEEINDLMTAFVKRDAAINVVFEKEIMESFIDMTPAWHRRGYGHFRDC